MDTFDASDFSGLSFESGFEHLLGQGTSSSSEPQPQQNDQQNSDAFNLGPQCPRCAKYRADLERSNNEHRVNFQFLKKKIISTDQLIRRCKAKQDDSEALAKMVEDLNAKLEHANRDSTILSEQLSSAVEEMKPLKEVNMQLENSLKDRTAEISDLHTKIAADEAYRNQKQALDSESKNLETAVLSMKRKILGLESKKQRLLTKTLELDREKASLTTEKNIFCQRMEVLAKALQQAQDIVNAQWRKLQMNGLTGGEKRPYVIPTRYKSFIAKIQAGDLVDEMSKLMEGDKETVGDGTAMSSEEDDNMVGAANQPHLTKEKTTKKKAKDDKDDKEKGKDDGVDNDCAGGFSDVSVFSDTDEEMGESPKKTVSSSVDTKDKDKVTQSQVDKEIKHRDEWDRVRGTETKLKGMKHAGGVKGTKQAGGIDSNTSKVLKLNRSLDVGSVVSGKTKGKRTLEPSEKNVEQAKVKESLKTVEKKQEMDVTKGGEDDADDLSSLSSLSDSDDEKEEEKNEAEKKKKKNKKETDFENAKELSFSNLIKSSSTKNEMIKFKTLSNMKQISSDYDEEINEQLKDKTKTTPKVNFTWKKKKIDGRSRPVPERSVVEKDMKNNCVNDLESLSSMSDTDDSDDGDDQLDKSKRHGGVEGKKSSMVADNALSELSESDENDENDSMSLPFTHIDDTDDNVSRDSSIFIPACSGRNNPEILGSVGKEELKSMLTSTLSSLFQALSPLPPSPCPTVGRKSDDRDNSVDNEDEDDIKEMGSDEVRASTDDKDDENDDGCDKGKNVHVRNKSLESIDNVASEKDADQTKDISNSKKDVVSGVVDDGEENSSISNVKCDDEELARKDYLNLRKEENEPVKVSSVVKDLPMEDEERATKTTGQFSGDGGGSVVGLSEESSLLCGDKKNESQSIHTQKVVEVESVLQGEQDNEFLNVSVEYERGGNRIDCDLPRCSGKVSQSDLTQNSDKMQETELSVTCNKSKESDSTLNSDKVQETELSVTCNKSKESDLTQNSDKIQETELSVTCNKSKENDLTQNSDKMQETELSVTCNKSKESDSTLNSDKVQETELSVTCNKRKESDLTLNSDKVQETELSVTCNKRKESDLTLNSDKVQETELSVTCSKSKESDLTLNSDKIRETELSVTCDKSKKSDMNQSSIKSFPKEGPEIHTPSSQTRPPMPGQTLIEQTGSYLPDKAITNLSKDDISKTKKSSVNSNCTNVLEVAESHKSFENLESSNLKSNEIVTPQSQDGTRKNEKENTVSDLHMSSDDSDSEATKQSPQQSEQCEIIEILSKEESGDRKSKERKGSDLRVNQTKKLKRSGKKSTTEADLSSLSDLSSSSDDEIDENNTRNQDKPERSKDKTNLGKMKEKVNKKILPLSSQKSSGFICTELPVKERREIYLVNGVKNESDCTSPKVETQRIKLKGTQRKFVSKEFVDLSSLSDSSPSDGEKCVKKTKTFDETFSHEDKSDKIEKEEEAVDCSSKLPATPRSRRSSRYCPSRSNADWSTDDDVSPLRVTRSRSGSLVDDGKVKKGCDPQNSVDDLSRNSEEITAKPYDLKKTERLQGSDDVILTPDSKGDCIGVDKSDKGCLSRKTQMECASQQLAKMIARAKAGNQSKNQSRKDAGVQLISAAKLAQSARLNAYRRTRAAKRATSEEPLQGGDQNEEEVKKTRNELTESKQLGDKKIENKNIMEVECGREETVVIDDSRSKKNCESTSPHHHHINQYGPVQRLTRSRASKVGKEDVVTSLDREKDEKLASSISKLKGYVENDPRDKINNSRSSDVTVRVNTGSPISQIKNVHIKKPDEAAIPEAAIPRVITHSSGTLGLDSSNATNDLIISPKLLLDDRLNDSGGFTVSVSSTHSMENPSPHHSADESIRSESGNPIVALRDAGEEKVKKTTQIRNEAVERNPVDATALSISSQGEMQVDNATELAEQKIVKLNVCDSLSDSGKLTHICGDVSVKKSGEINADIQEDRHCDSEVAEGVSEKGSAMTDEDEDKVCLHSPRKMSSLIVSVNSAFSRVESSVNHRLCASTNPIIVPSSCTLSSPISSVIRKKDDINSTCDNGLDLNREIKKPRKKFSTLENVSILQKQFVPASDLQYVKTRVLIENRNTEGQALHVSEPLEIIIPTTSSSTSVPPSSTSSSSLSSNVTSSSSTDRQSPKALKRPFSQVLTDMVNFFKMPRLLSPISSPLSSPTQMSAQDEYIASFGVEDSSNLSAISPVVRCSDSQMMNKARKILAKRKATATEERKTTRCPDGVKRSKRLVAQVDRKNAGDAGSGKTVKPLQKTISFSGFSSLQDAVDYSLRHFLSHDSPHVFTTVENLSAQAKDGNIAEVWYFLANRIILHLHKVLPQSDPWLERVCGSPLDDQLTTQTSLEPLEVSILQLVTAFCDRHSEVIDRSVLMGSLWSAIFDQSLTSTGVRLSLCRLFCGMCKHQGDVEQARLLLHNIGWCGYLFFSSCLLSILGVWPSIIPPIGGSALPPPICQVFELVISLERKEEPELVKRVQTVIEKLCGWKIKHPPPAASTLLKLMVDSMSVMAKSSQGNLFEYTKAVELLCVVMGPAWTQDNFVMKTLIASFQKWNKTSSVSDVANVMVALLQITKAVLAVQSFSETTMNVLTGQIFGKVVVTKLDSLPLTICFGEVLMELSPLHPDRSLELLRQWEETNGSALPPHVLSQLSQTRSFINTKKKGGGGGGRGGGGGIKNKKSKKGKGAKPKKN